MELFIQSAISDPFHYFSWVFIVIFSICVHEYAHAAAALRLGDDTAANGGHLTLNPLVQMGGMSLVALLLAGVSWGAVPVNPYLLGRRRAWVSFAGPFSNFILCVVFSLLAALSVILPASVANRELLAHFFELGSNANAMLFIFNLLPIPMLDGWSVLAGFFPKMDSIDRTTASNISWLLLAVFLMSPLRMVVWGGAYYLSDTLIALCLRPLGY